MHTAIEKARLLTRCHKACVCAKGPDHPLEQALQLHALLWPLMMRFDVAPCLESTLLAQGVVSREESDELLRKTLRVVGDPNAILFCRCDTFESL